MVRVDLQDYDAVGVSVDAQDVAHPYIGIGKLKQLSGREAAKGRVAEQKGKARAAAPPRIDAALPFVEVVIGPGHPLGVLVLHGDHRLVYLVLLRLGRRRLNRKAQAHHQRQSQG